ncbi:PREDICTED: protein MARD1-like [Nicotiana attenuata]|uniref:Protein mard1 n=1 Tax=Nicotiana attenuata TaxID=49451 RepID=A0A1J6LAN5_NICAT|nr:PREDICTED: protein MARD1-like [Nicotiana attenuata]OIT28081.1 protein mard1 [Nicotiana attenuata]
MIGKRSTPVIGKLTGAAFSGSRKGIMEGATSPRSPLDFKIQSPRGLKSFDFGGVGLAIVAALEKSGGKYGETPANKAVVYNRNSNRTLPIPVNSTKNSALYKPEFDETEMDSFEEYTIVTCRAPGNKSYTKVYGGGTAVQARKCNRPSVFDISPARLGDFPACPDSDFLSSCHLCQKKLHGKDIYMYRGEKAFCSTECRYRQIAIDEHKEKCSSEIARSVDVASSPYGNGQIFATGILAI